MASLKLGIVEKDIFIYDFRIFCFLRRHHTVDLVLPYILL